MAEYKFAARVLGLHRRKDRTDTIRRKLFGFHILEQSKVEVHNSLAGLPNKGGKVSVDEVFG